MLSQMVCTHTKPHIPAGLTNTTYETWSTRELVTRTTASQHVGPSREGICLGLSHTTTNSHAQSLSLHYRNNGLGMNLGQGTLGTLNHRTPTLMTAAVMLKHPVVTPPARLCSILPGLSLWLERTTHAG